MTLCSLHNVFLVRIGTFSDRSAQLGINRFRGKHVKCRAAHISGRFGVEQDRLDPIDDLWVSHRAVAGLGKLLKASVPIQAALPSD